MKISLQILVSSINNAGVSVICDELHVEINFHNPCLVLIIFWAVRKSSFLGLIDFSRGWGVCCNVPKDVEAEREKQEMRKKEENQEIFHRSITAYSKHSVIFRNLHQRTACRGGPKGMGALGKDRPGFPGNTSPHYFLLIHPLSFLNFSKFFFS